MNFYWDPNKTKRLNIVTFVAAFGEVCERLTKSADNAASGLLSLSTIKTSLDQLIHPIMTLSSESVMLRALAEQAFKETLGSEVVSRMREENRVLEGKVHDLEKIVDKLIKEKTYVGHDRSEPSQPGQVAEGALALEGPSRGAADAQLGIGGGESPADARDGSATSYEVGS
jgi:hypothetical protein